MRVKVGPIASMDTTMSEKPYDPYENNPLIHRDRRLGRAASAWARSFACEDMSVLIVCRGPIRKEAIDVFHEMGMERVGILLSEKDSIVYPRALAPEIRRLDPARVHALPDYTGATKEERRARIDRMIAICREHGYGYIFAGYGFMAEDEAFVRAIEDAGLQFIGPCSYTVSSAGSKDTAKRTALENDVSVTPGINNATARTLLRKYPDRKALRAIAAEHGLEVPALGDEALPLEQVADEVLEASYGKGVDLYTIDELGEQIRADVADMMAEYSGNRVRLKAIGGGGGKTHLVNAVGHTILRQRPGSRILYVSAERFTNEFIWSLQNHRINDFRSRYRTKCDVLLMDDIQFLAGRDQTQEEFFHTFNALYHSDKQIVVTSDVYPQQIAEMEERLISRFQSGMVADIQPPELDTRVAILMKKAELEKIPLSSEVAHFLAQVVKSNVRELEGTLLRLAVKAELLNHPIDLDLARDTMRAVLPKPEAATTVEDIQRAVCNYFGIRLSDLKSKRRHRTVSFPRMVAMYICRQRLGTSYPELGERFGGKDHTTVISAVRKIGGLVEAEDEKVVGSIDAIERKLGV